MKTLSLLFICVTQNNSTDYGSNLIYKHKKKNKQKINLCVNMGINNITNFSK